MRPCKTFEQGLEVVRGQMASDPAMEALQLQIQEGLCSLFVECLCVMLERLQFFMLEYGLRFVSC